LDAPPQPAIDPFADDIVEDPRHVDYSVPGLNDAVAGAVLDGIEALQAPGRPRVTARSGKAMLVLSPQAGFGKSHLVGVLFKRLSGRATLVNVRPFEDPETCWKSVLMRLVQELDFPDRQDAPGGAPQDAPTQMELFGLGVLSQAVAEHLSERRGNPATIEQLRRPAEELVWLKRSRKWRAAMDQRIGNSRWIGEVRQRLVRQGLGTRVSLQSWLGALYGYVHHDGDWDLRQSCLDWVQGDPIDEDMARRMGLRPAEVVRADPSAGAVNELAKSRVLDLCSLAGLFRPFLICFDQTETYGKSAELARALGTVMTDLTDEGRNQLALLTANVDPWEKRLRAHWEEASLGRLARPLVLEGISATQGRDLIQHRLRLFEIPRARCDRFRGDEHWLDELFRERPQMSVRMFLHGCSRRWRETGDAAPDTEVAGGDPPPLPVLFQRYIDEISAQPRRLVYDRDTFYWLVTELAAGVEGIRVDRLASGASEHMPRWWVGEKQLVFGFESGGHWKRWHNIARSVLEGGKRRGCILVYPRTPELAGIPKPTWKVASPDIERARRSRLLILELDKLRLARLYAARELYADALQGDIDWQPEAVAEFLRQELADFWRSILEWPGHGVPQAAGGPEPASGALQRRVVDVVRKHKLLSLEDLLGELPGQPDRETVLGVCGEAEGVKVHTHPNKTLLQWRSAG